MSREFTKCGTETEQEGGSQTGAPSDVVANVTFTIQENHLSQLGTDKIASKTAKAAGGSKSINQWGVGDWRQGRRYDGVGEDIAGLTGGGVG